MFIPRLFSLSDVVDELVLAGYELCDGLWASDHRPVSSVFRLNLLPALKRRSSFDLQCRQTLSQTQSIQVSEPSRLTLASEVSDSPPRPPALPSYRSNSRLSPFAFQIRLSEFELFMETDQPPVCDWDSLPVSMADRSGHSRGSRSEREVEEASVSSLSNRMTSNWASHVGVFFPLPSETCLESSRVVRHLDSTLFPDTSSQGILSRAKSTILYGSSYISWDDAKANGIKTSANVVLPSAEGTLHAAIRLIDSSGEPLAVGVIPIPRCVGWSVLITGGLII